MRIIQPRVASSELPWGKGPNVLYSERVASISPGALGGAREMRPVQSGFRILDSAEAKDNVPAGPLGHRIHAVSAAQFAVGACNRIAPLGPPLPPLPRLLPPRLPRQPPNPQSPTRPPSRPAPKQV